MKKQTNKFNYKLGNGGKLKPPIIVNDKNDPRLRAYNDSLYSYNLTKKYEGKFPVVSNEISDKITGLKTTPSLMGHMPIGWYEKPSNDPNTDAPSFSPKYKKPVQPVKYQEQLTPITNEPMKKKFMTKQTYTNKKGGYYNNGDNTGRQEFDLGGILSGTASGASMGSSLGPYGALVGALLGGVSSGVGGVMGENRELASYDKLVNNTQLKNGGKLEKLKLDPNKKNLNPKSLKYNGVIDLPFGTGVTPYTSLISKGINKIPLVGQIGDDLVQGYDNITKYLKNLEGEGIGSAGGYAYGGNMTESINAGGTHEENPYEGVNIGNKGLVEEGEVKFNYKDKTGDNSYIFSKRLGFANKAKSIMKKFDIRPSDKMALEAKEQRLKGLMNEQEAVRSSMFDNQFKKAFGGGLKKYLKGGKFDQFAPEIQTDNADIQANDLASLVGKTEPVFNNETVGGNHFGRVFNDTQERSDILNAKTPKISAFNNISTNKEIKPYNKGLNKLGQYGQFAGSLARLATAAQGPDAVNLQRMNEPYLNSLPEEITAGNEIGQVFNTLNNDIRNNSGSNAGTYLSNRLASAGNQADKIGQVQSGIRSKYAQLNNQNKLAVGRFNAQTQHTEDDLRTREKDAVRTLGIDAAGLAGNTLGNITRDDTANSQQNDIINSMQTGNYKWGINPETDRIAIMYLQQAKQQALGGYMKGFGGFMYKSKGKKC